MFIVFVFRNTFSDIISSIDDIMATHNDIHEISSDCGFSFSCLKFQAPFLRN